jgi:hypothetical protein
MPSTRKHKEPPLPSTTTEGGFSPRKTKTAKNETVSVAIPTHREHCCKTPIVQHAYFFRSASSTSRKLHLDSIWACEIEPPESIQSWTHTTTWFSSTLGTSQQWRYKGGPRCTGRHHIAINHSGIAGHTPVDKEEQASKPKALSTTDVD